MTDKVKMAFEPEGVMLPLNLIEPVKLLPKNIRKQMKYRRIAASVQDVGIIEPLIVYPQNKKATKNGKYTLLDGHLRLDVLTEMGVGETLCLISTDDEAYTYNHQLNRVSTIQEHFMILKALDSGVSEERLAKALDLDIKKIKEKRSLLAGVCAEAVSLLKDKIITAKAIKFYKQVKPMRQIEMAELMIASNNYTTPYARAMYLASPNEQLIHADTPKEGDGVSSADIARMENEMETIERDFQLVTDTYARNMLNLVVCRNYLTTLLDNARIVRFLSKEAPEFLSEFQKIVEAASLEA